MIERRELGRGAFVSSRTRGRPREQIVRLTAANGRIAMYIERARIDSGKPLLLLHGGGVAGWMWTSLREHLPPKFDLIVPDLPGHDRSSGDPYRSQPETVSTILDYLDAEVEGPVAVVGFSFGAQLAVHLAARVPERVSHVTVISAQAIPSRFPRLTKSMLSVAAPLAASPQFARMQAKELFIPESQLDVYVRTSTTLSRRDLVGVVDDNIRFTPPAAWADFGGSALILAGATERGVIKRSAAVLRSALAGSALEIVEGCGHGIPLQRPAWLASRLAAQIDIV